jgi:putative FmdB family regulatory protein
LGNILIGEEKMPIYEYRCKKCEAVFETFVSSISDADKVSCKRCKSKDVVKQISSFSSRLAGSSSNAPAGALSGCSSKSGFS